jgi:quinol monooxygenase YgiN
MAKRKAKGGARRRSSRRRTKGATVVKLPKHAVTLTVIVRAKEGQELLLEGELRALVAPTRREAGCLQYDLHRSTELPGQFFLHEVWETREHHTAHTRTPHFLRWNARKDALLTAREATFWQQIA